MKPIIIGKSGGKNVEIDVDLLVRTRLLIQANSGGGKSWALRRLAEQLFGKFPVHIIDPEGEFSTLREKYGYVLVGKGGETPADLRSAGLVAHKLLELRASAVLDLYDLKPESRHLWIKLYLESLMNVPKNLWNPTFIIIDEAHLFAPEKGQGESAAYGSVVDLVTRGRKRGFCAILATQRLSKLSKNASGEMTNRLVGMTFEDVDLVRAADLLSVPRPDRLKFFKEMKLLEPGKFYGLGRAISRDRIMITVGKVLTTHPEPGAAGYSAVPPPAPSKVRAMFPKLKDLPQAAEEKATTERELKREIRDLKAALKAKPNPQPAKGFTPAKVEIKKVPVITRQEAQKVHKMICRLETAARKLSNVSELESELRAVEKLLGGKLSDAVEAAENLQKQKRTIAVLPPRPVQRPAPVPRSTFVRVRNRVSPHEGNGNAVPLDKASTKILTVLAQYSVEGCTINKIALLAGYRVTGTFRNALGALRTKGYITGGNTETMHILAEGDTALGEYDPLPEGRELAEYWLHHAQFGRPEKAVISTLLENQDGMTIDELAEATNYQVTGTFRNALGSMRTAGVLVGKNTKRMTLSADLLE